MLPFVRMFDYGNVVEPPVGTRYTCSDYSATYSLIKDGVLYVSGMNNYYQLGNNTNVTRYNEWLKVPETDSVKFCSTGYGQTMYLTNNGRIMIAGEDPTFGATAVSVKVWTDITSRFSAVDTRKIVYISIERYGVMMIMQDGSVWACGVDNTGWSGQGSKTVGFFTFRQIYTGSAGSAVACTAGTGTARILLANGTILSAGTNTYHQCNASTDPAVLTFTESFPGVDPSLIYQIKMCNNNCIIFLSDKRYYGTGWGSFGALGDGDITGSNNKFYAGTLSVAPKNMRAYMSYLCSSSGDSSMYIGDDNFIYTCGYRGRNLINATTDIGTFTKCIQSAQGYKNGLIYSGNYCAVVFDPDLGTGMTYAVSSPKVNAPAPQASVPTLGMSSLQAIILP